MRRPRSRRTTRPGSGGRPRTRVGTAHAAVVAIAAVGMILAACAATAPAPSMRDTLGRAAEDVLDDLHRAAAEADGPRYLGHFTDHAVFIGTDASERWALPEFAAYVRSHFSRGTGWTYVPFERHVVHATDGCTAWFDERLHNERYGEARGTGVLVRDDGRWRIAQYNLAFPIPNEIAGEVTARIAELADR